MSGVLRTQLLKSRCRTARERELVEVLCQLTGGAMGSATPCNYSVWDGGVELESGPSRDSAVGFARGRNSVGALYNGNTCDAHVRCGAMVVWPEERWGEGVFEEGFDNICSACDRVIDPGQAESGPNGDVHRTCLPSVGDGMSP